MRYNFLEKPEGWKYWTKKAARGCFPIRQDFDGVKDALLILTGCLLIITGRAFLLCLAPISIPLLAIIFTKLNRKTMEDRAKLLLQDVRGRKSYFTKEDVDSVLNGEKTFAHIIKEKESKY